jgi:hypothetical protein
MLWLHPHDIDVIAAANNFSLAAQVDDHSETRSGIVVSTQHHPNTK